MTELLYKILNMWKKNISFLLVFILFIACEIPYITSLQGTDEIVWYKCINYFFVFLWALPSLVTLIYIFSMRIYIPKAKKNTKGIVFYIVNANEKQYQSINKKFVAQFKKSVNKETSEYSVVVIDDYHSQKYYPILCELNNNDGEKQAKLLKKRRCCIAILIDCINGGDGEELFCHMSTTLGITHRAIPNVIRDYLIKDISTAFSPLRNVDIMKLTETSDLSQYSTSMDVICKYILASTCFHCCDFLGAIKIFETLNNNLSVKKDLPEMVLPIKNVLGNRLAVCWKVIAEYEYYLYCNDHSDNHLIEVRNAINNKYCKKTYEYENKILEGICCFVLDNNIDYSIQCMNLCNTKDPAIKFNKAFLLLYRNCTVNYIFKIYNLYKDFYKLPENVQEQIEEFTFYEYRKDEKKKQLLLILFFIYDYRGDMILAKRCFDEFCSAFPWVFESRVSSVFDNLNKKYADIILEEGETYSI